MMRSVLLVLAVLSWFAVVEAADLPQLPAGTWECHGQATLSGQDAPQRFWLRLLPPDAAFGGNRMLQVVYTPAPAPALGGTHLADSPFLLLDPQARLVAWNDRNGLSQATSGGKSGPTYTVARERTAADQQTPVAQPRTFTGERGWEVSSAPLLLAMAWHAGTRAQLPVYDLFGDGVDGGIAWNDAAVTASGRSWRVEADAQGRLKRLLDEHGLPLVIVQEWLKEGH